MSAPELDGVPSLPDEASRILSITGSPLRAYELVEHQMGVLVLRTQVLLSLSGIVITVTGFSGRAIAETGALARWSVAAGLVVVLLAAAVAFSGVLRLRWLTQILSEDPHETLVRALRLRDHKSRMLQIALRLFVVGFGLYCFAVAQLIVATPTR